MRYTFTGWRQFIGSASFEVDAQGQAEVLYTVELNAGEGRFADGTSVKRVQGAAGETLPAIGEPVPPEGVAGQYAYVFDGWSATLPATFTQNLVLNAVYRRVDNQYEIVFDAGAGYFDGDPTKTAVSQIYTYGQTVVAPADPARANVTEGGSTYGYAFVGWSPAVQAVTANQNYTALYRKYLVGGEVGITVSDGLVTEDISVGSLGEYSYFVHETLGVPTLRVTTGTAITISGTSDDLRIEIDAGVTEVRFKDLDISVDGASTRCTTSLKR